MLSANIQSILLEKEYKAERNTGLFRCAVLIGAVTAAAALSVKNAEYRRTIIPLCIFLFIAIIIIADLVLVYKHPKARRFIKISKFLSTPMDAVFFTLLIDFIRTTRIVYIDYVWGAALLMLCAAALTMALCAFRYSALTAIINGVLMISGYMYLNFIRGSRVFFIKALQQGKYVVLDEIAFYAVTIILTVFSAALALRQKKIIVMALRRQEFKRYLPEKRVKEIIAGQAFPGPEGQRTKATVLYADIKNFTKIVETRDPQTIVGALNSFVEEMVEIIFKYDGTLDNIIGDGIVAFFGAPFAPERAAENAVRAAIAMQNEVAGLDLGIPLQMGVGIHSGGIIAGRIGSKTNKTYSIIGETVNTAIRIQELTKPLKRQIIISEAVRALLPEGIDAQKLGRAKIKGSTQGVVLYAPIAI